MFVPIVYPARPLKGPGTGYESDRHTSGCRLGWVLSTGVKMSSSRKAASTVSLEGAASPWKGSPTTIEHSVAVQKTNLLAHIHYIYPQLTSMCICNWQMDCRSGVQVQPRGAMKKCDIGTMKKCDIGTMEKCYKCTMKMCD
jgi:hypothetical protein